MMDSLERPFPEVDRKIEQNQQILAKFTEFKASGEFSDFTIKIRGKDFKVHKAVLAAQSPVFNKTFTSNDDATEQTFTKVKNFSGEAFESLMDFFYSGNLGDDVDAMKIFELATVFEVSVLKTICIDRILDTLCQANALEAYNFARQHNLDQLKQEAFKVIHRMFPELRENVINSPDHVNRLVKAKREYEESLTAAIVYQPEVEVRKNYVRKDIK